MAGGLRLIADGALALVGIRTLEEPPFTVADTLAPDLVVRAYAPRLAAETVVQGSGYPARSEGFQRLARYIFGGNQGRSGIAMTAPVAAAETIAMTIPVVAGAQANPGQLVMRFFLPSDLTEATAPRPLDPRVRIVVEPARQVAVLRWSGAIRPEATRKAEATLLARLAATRWQPVAAPESWFYDPPSTPAFLRRNEAVVAVAAAAG